MARLRAGIFSQIFDDRRSENLNGILNRAGRAAAQVRDRLSTDLLRIVSQLAPSLVPRDLAWGYVTAGEALAVLNRCVSVRGAARVRNGEHDSRPRMAFPRIGRRIERSIQLVKLFRASSSAGHGGDLCLKSCSRWPIVR